MKYVKERTLMIVIIIVQFIVIGVLSSMIILNDDEKEVEYSSSHIVIEYLSESYEWSRHSTTLRIHSDGFYSLKNNYNDGKAKTSYLEEGQLEDITYFLTSHNISEYNGYRRMTTNSSNQQTTNQPDISLNKDYNIRVYAYNDITENQQTPIYNYLNISDQPLKTKVIDVPSTTSYNITATEKTATTIKISIIPPVYNDKNNIL